MVQSRLVRQWWYRDRPGRQAWMASASGAMMAKRSPSAASAAGEPSLPSTTPPRASGKSRVAQAEATTVERYPRSRAARARRADAHVRHESAEDQFVASGGFHAVVQLRPREGIGQTLADDGFAVMGGHCFGDGAVGSVQIEQAPGTALVDDVEDRRAGGPGAFQQVCRFVEGGADIGQGKAAIDVFVLAVDKHEHGLGQSGGGGVSPGHGKQGLGRVGHLDRSGSEKGQVKK